MSFDQAFLNICSVQVMFWVIFHFQPLGRRRKEEVLDNAGSRSPGNRPDFQLECILKVPIACSMEIS